MGAIKKVVMMTGTGGSVNKRMRRIFTNPRGFNLRDQRMGTGNRILFQLS
jgi:hypothetical protein